MEWIKERVGDGASWAYFSVSLDLSKLIYLHSKGDPDLDLESIYLGPIHNNGICSLTLPGILPCVA